MENLFLRYMHERVRRKEEQIVHELGPVITISRQYGCYGSEVAEKLAKKINECKKLTGEREEWMFISHQVFYEAARALEVKPEEISHIFGAEQKSMFGDLVSIFSKAKYLSDIQIKRMIAQIVRSYSEQGNAIIVGRAGCVIARHIKRSIHIKLIAPFNWRVNAIKKRYSISLAEASSNVKETDKRRETFLEFFRGNMPDSHLFDVILNRSTLSTDEIVNQIYHLAQQRNLI